MVLGFLAIDESPKQARPTKPSRTAGTAIPSNGQHVQQCKPICGGLPCKAAIAANRGACGSYNLMKT